MGLGTQDDKEGDAATSNHVAIAPPEPEQAALAEVDHVPDDGVHADVLREHHCVDQHGVLGSTPSAQASQSQATTTSGTPAGLAAAFGNVPPITVDKKSADADHHVDGPAAGDSTPQDGADGAGCRGDALAQAHHLRECREGRMCGGCAAVALAP